MQRSIVVWLIALVGSLLIGAAVPTIAHAETCSPDGKICLVTETDPNNPLVPPATLQFRVVSETTQLGVSPPSYPHLVTQGPPGGMSLWEATLQASSVQQDGQISLEVLALGSSFEYEATFQILVRAPAVNYSVTITRLKQKVVATYQFDARVPLKAVVQLWLDSFKGGTHILTHRGRTIPATGTGHQVLRVAIPRKTIDRKCGTKLYPHCSVLASGYLWSGEYPNPIYRGSFDRKRVK